MPNDKSTPEPEASAQQETGGDSVSRLVLGSSSTPITDQRLELLKRGHSNCVPKWEDFAKEMEREMHKWKAECKRHRGMISSENSRALAQPGAQDSTSTTNDL